MELGSLLDQLGAPWAQGSLQLDTDHERVDHLRHNPDHQHIRGLVKQERPHGEIVRGMVREYHMNLVESVCRICRRRLVTSCWDARAATNAWKPLLSLSRHFPQRRDSLVWDIFRAKVKAVSSIPLPACRSCPLAISNADDSLLQYLLEKCGGLEV